MRPRFVLTLLLIALLAFIGGCLVPNRIAKFCLFSIWMLLPLYTAWKTRHYSLPNEEYLLRRHFNGVLQDLQAQRAKRKDWVLYEQRVLLDIINRERSNLGKKPITSERFKRVEALAVGHSDYNHKMALYCTDLIYETGIVRC